LGGRLCTSQDVNSNDETDILGIKREIRKQLTATVMTPAGGFDHGANKTKNFQTTSREVSADETTRMTIQTQGGNALKAARYVPESHLFILLTPLLLAFRTGLPLWNHTITGE